MKYYIQKRGIIISQKSKSKKGNYLSHKKNLAIDSDLRTVKNFFQDLPMVVYSALPDEHSTTILVTDAIKDITGYSASEFYKKLELWEEIVYGEDKDDVWKAIKKHRKDKAPLKLIYRIVTKSRDIKWLKDEAIPVLDKNKQIVRINGFLEDITELKKIRNQVRYQSTLVDNVSDAIISMDLDFKILSWNAAAEKIYGWTEKEVIGKRLVDLVNPRYGKITRDDVLKIFSKTGHWTGEMIQKNKNGSDLVIQSSGSYIKDNIGKPIGIVAVNRDVTHFKKSEKALKVSEEKYRNLFNTMSQGVVYQDAEGKIISCNPAAERVLGLTIDQMQGRTSSDPRWKAIHEDGTDFTGDTHPSMQALKTGKKVRNVIMGVFNPKNDDYTWININAIPQFKSGEKKPYQVYTTFEDITQIELAEKALKKSEERYRLAQQAAEIGSWDWNIVTDDLEWSETIEPMFGFKKGKFDKTYEAFLDCIHPDDRQFVIDSVNDCLEKNKEYDIEHRIIWPNGSVHWVRETGDVIRDKDGKPVRMLGIVQEITDFKKNEEQIKKLNESLWQYTIRLEAANKEVEAFSYSVSHDLRAPLRSIDGFSQALLEDYADKLDEIGIDYLNRVRNASQRMGQLIDSMLQLSRLSRKEMHIENVDMTELSMDIINKFRKEDSSRNVDFKVQDNLIIRGDKNLIQILLENLLGNAWKFTSKRSNAKIEFGENKKKNEIVFFIKDNGAGFDAKYADKLFVPFQRLHDDEFPGDGIGLGIVSRIIRRHGGQIWAEGEVGKGAIFYFRLGGKKHE